VLAVGLVNIGHCLPWFANGGVGVNILFILDVSRLRWPPLPRSAGTGPPPGISCRSSPPPSLGCAIVAPARTPLTLRPVLWIGEWFYAIYLWHLPLILLAVQHGYDPARHLRHVRNHTNVARLGNAA
jgi:hypothetical protein